MVGGGVERRIAASCVYRICFYCWIRLAHVDAESSTPALAAQRRHRVSSGAAPGGLYARDDVLLETQTDVACHYRFASV